VTGETPGENGTNYSWSKANKREQVRFERRIKQSSVASRAGGTDVSDELEKKKKKKKKNRDGDVKGKKIKIKE